MLGKVLRANVNEWLETDDGFVEEYDLAFEDFIDSLLETMIALGKGTLRGKVKPNFTALIALLNAFHDSFKTMGREALESKLSQAVLVIAEIAKKYIAEADQPKFLEEVAGASVDAGLGLRRKKSRE